MSARLIAYYPEGSAQEFLLPEGDSRIGRDTGSDVCLRDASVSRAHALLRVDSGGNCELQDLGSKNGSFVDGIRVDRHGWRGAGWLRFGDVRCELLPLDGDAWARLQARRHSRDERLQALTARVAASPSGPDLLPSIVAAVVELAGCERGCLLLWEQGSWQLGAALGMAAESLGSPAFTGSSGALARARDSKRAIVLNDIGDDPEMAARQSVLRGGIRALICLPLLAGGVPLGVVYADSRRPGAVITDLDLQLLDAFAEQAGLWVAASKAAATLASLERSTNRASGDAGAADRDV